MEKTVNLFFKNKQKRRIRKKGDAPPRGSQAFFEVISVKK